jgi:hypothetical protein
VCACVENNVTVARVGDWGVQERYFLMGHFAERTFEDVFK